MIRISPAARASDGGYEGALPLDGGEYTEIKRYGETF